MMNYNNTGYGYNYNQQMPYNNFPQMQNNNYSTSQQNRLVIFPAIYVSDKAEVNSYPPDQSNNPSFFYNRSKEEIYIKQYDNTGAAPIRTYRLAADNLPGENAKKDINLYEEKFNAINDRLDGLKSIIENLIPLKTETGEIKGKK